MAEQTVNIWTLMTSATSRDCPHKEQCNQFINIASAASKFGNEATVKMTDLGEWEFKVFDSYEGRNEVTFRILSGGRVVVERRTEGEITDTRRISF